MEPYVSCYQVCLTIPAYSAENVDKYKGKDNQCSDNNNGRKGHFGTAFATAKSCLHFPMFHFP